MNAASRIYHEINSLKAKVHPLVTSPQNPASCLADFELLHISPPMQPAKINWAVIRSRIYSGGMPQSFRRSESLVNGGKSTPEETPYPKERDEWAEYQVHWL